MKTQCFLVKNKLLDPENPQFAVFGIKIGQKMTEKELLVKKRDSGPVCIVRQNKYKNKYEYLSNNRFLRLKILI